MIESRAFIKTHPARLLLLPSLLCLDAPLAALGWASCLSFDLTKHALNPASLPNLAALFLSVWIIYLLDRLYDVFRAQHPGILTVRHDWARRHPVPLAALAFVATGILAISIIPALEPSILLAALGPGLTTLVYYLAFRFSRLHSRFSKRAPCKELMIGTCFALGIAIAVYPGELKFGFSLLTGGLALLFSANCLLISRAEAEIDSSRDPAAHFAKNRRGIDSRVHERLALLSMIAGIPVATGGVFILSSIGLFACGAMTLALARAGWNSRKPLTQACADGILLFPWLLIGGAAIRVILIS